MHEEPQMQLQVTRVRDYLFRGVGRTRGNLERSPNEVDKAHSAEPE